MRHVSLHLVLSRAVILPATALISLWGNVAMAMTLSSPAFQQNGHIPSKYTCEGEDISSPLTWEGVPDDAKSLVLIIDDPDAPDPKAPKMVGYIGSSTIYRPILRACPRTQARQGCRKAPCLGSMISKRPAMAARVRQSAGTVTSISSTR
jgi:hypothetical protein